MYSKANYMTTITTLEELRPLVSAVEDMSVSYTHLTLPTNREV